LVAASSRLGKAADEKPANYGWLKETQQDPLSEVIMLVHLVFFLILYPIFVGF
jgi:hypothetical protein